MFPMSASNNKIVYLARTIAHPANVKTFSWPQCVLLRIVVGVLNLVRSHSCTMENEELTFENNFYLMMLGLRWSFSDLSQRKDLLYILKLLYSIGIPWLSNCLLTNSVIFHDMKIENKTEALKNCFMVVVTVNIHFKLFILNYYRKSIANNVDFINSDYHKYNMSSMSLEYKSIVQKYIKKGIRVCQLWLLVSSFTATIFPLKALVLMAYYAYKGQFKLVKVYDLTFPDFMQTDDYTLELIIFVGFFIIQVLFDCFAAAMFLGFDPLGPIFMLHACSQLEIIESKILGLFSETADSESVSEKLKDVITSLKKVYKFVNDTNEIFSVVFEINLKCTIVGIPFTAIQIIEAFRNSEINLEFMSFFIGLIILGFVPCFFSDLLKEKGECLRQAIYACGWEGHRDLKQRKTLLIMLTRAMEPPVLRSVFSTLCLDTFSKVCHSAYALFNLLNATS